MKIFNSWKRQRVDWLNLVCLNWSEFAANYQSSEPMILISELDATGLVAVNCLAPKQFAFMHDQPIPSDYDKYWRLEAKKFKAAERTLVKLLQTNGVDKTSFGVNFLCHNLFPKFGSILPVGYHGILEWRNMLVPASHLDSFLGYLDTWILQLGMQGIRHVPAGIDASEWLDSFHSQSNHENNLLKLIEERRHLFDINKLFMTSTGMVEAEQLSRKQAQAYLDAQYSGLIKLLEQLEQSQGQYNFFDDDAALAIPYHLSGTFMPSELEQSILHLVRVDERLSLDLSQCVSICELRAKVAYTSESLVFYNMVIFAIETALPNQQFCFNLYGLPQGHSTVSDATINYLKRYLDYVYQCFPVLQMSSADLLA